MRDKYLVAVVRSSGNDFVEYLLITYTPFKCNLKPANMRGIKSFAMVLAVSECVVELV
jgi:tRNA-binding EMAP/Myf-like protein